MGQVCSRVTGTSGGDGDDKDPGCAEAGRKLLEEAEAQSKSKGRYSHIDALWRHPQTGAVLYVGSAEQAQNREGLRSFHVKRVVNCQDQDEGQNYFEGDPDLMYLRFKIGKWRKVSGVGDGGAGTWGFWEPLFIFVSEGLRKGQNIFIHCLAGAHRAGTAAIGLLMFLFSSTAQAAILTAKSLRPVIEPIGTFRELLDLLERALVSRQQAIQILLSEENDKGNTEEEECVEVAPVKSHIITQVKSLAG